MLECLIRAPSDVLSKYVAEVEEE
jgi:hypothetical protein